MTTMYDNPVPRRPRSRPDRYSPYDPRSRRAEELDYAVRAATPGTPEYAEASRARMPSIPEIAAMSPVPVLSEAGEAALMARAAQEGRWGDVGWGALGLAVPFVGGAALKRGADWLGSRSAQGLPTLPVEQMGAEALMEAMRQQLPAQGLTGIFAGEAAKTADLDLLKVAKEAELMGLSDERIFDATGWFRGADDKWRFEVSDENALLSAPPKRHKIANDWLRRNGYVGADEPKYVGVGTPRIPQEAQKEALAFADYKLAESHLGDQYRHPELYAAYPEMKGLKLHWGGENPGSLGTYYEGGVIGLKPPTMAGSVITPGEVLAHELQHGVQYKEGFGYGGTSSQTVWASPTARPELVKIANEIMDDWKPAPIEQFWGDAPITQEARDAYKEYVAAFNSPEEYRKRWRAAQEAAPRKYYERLSGEVEARNVEARLSLTSDDRRMVYPWTTQDVPTERQIVRRPPPVTFYGE